MKMKKTYLSAVAILVCAALVGGIAGTSFYTKRHFKEDIVTGPNVTEVFKLSRYNPNLEGTIGDSDVYVLKGEKEGGSLVVLAAPMPTNLLGIWPALFWKRMQRLRRAPFM